MSEMGRIDEIRARPSIHKFALAAETLGMTMDALWSGSGREASDG